METTVSKYAKLVIHYAFFKTTTTTAKTATTTREMCFAVTCFFITVFCFSLRSSLSVLHVHIPFKFKVGFQFAAVRYAKRAI